MINNIVFPSFKVKMQTGKSTFQYSAAADRNSFLQYLRDVTSLKRFKLELYKDFRDLDINSCRCSLT